LITIIVGRMKGGGARSIVDALVAAHTQIRVLGSAHGESALERAVASWAPDAAILDETVDHSLLVRLRASRPLMGLVVVARSPSPLYGTMLLAGGVTCIAYETKAADVVAAIKATAHGGQWFLSADGLRVAREQRHDIRLLTPRERQVLAHLAHDKSYAEIGLALQIGVETVRTHTTRICRKLSVSSRRELIGLRVAPDINRPLD
jgi:two-component system nitrate/nitrite response regulator NarL